MNRYTKFLAATCVATAFLATAGHAATFSLNVDSSAGDDFADPTDAGDSDKSAGAFEDSIDLLFSSATGRSAASAEFFADPETGILKSVTTAKVTDGSALRASATGIGGITIDETFTASGSGTATFAFAFDGLLRAAGVLGSASVLAEMSIFSLPPGGGVARPEVEWSASTGYRDNILRTFINGEQLDDPVEELTVDEEILLSIDVVDTQKLEFKLRFQTQASSVEGTSGSGGADFGATGYLDFSTTSGLTLSASDPNFLSNAGGSTAPVPVPASLGFLMAGLGLLGATRLRKRA